jgi:hypothetical protein
MEKEKIKIWKENNNTLLREMELWRDEYICINDCEDWKRHRFCKHLVNARNRKFKKDVNKQLQSIGGLIN